MLTMGPDVAEGAVVSRMERIAESCLSIERMVMQVLSAPDQEEIKPD
jgi:hypothetical protein